jgi:hypothetical protein
MKQGVRTIVGVAIVMAGTSNLALAQYQQPGYGPPSYGQPNLPCPEPAGRHRISVSARIRRAGHPRLRHAGPSGRCGGRQSRRRGSRRCSCQRRHQRGYRRYRAGAFRRAFAAGLWRLSATRLWCNPSAGLWLPSEVSAAPQAGRRSSRRLPQPRCSDGGVTLRLSAQAALNPLSPRRSA